MSAPTCNACGHVHAGRQFADICIGCPCGVRPEPHPPALARAKVKRSGGAVALTEEQAEALRRCLSKPDLDGGNWDEVRMRRVYNPLVRDLLLAESVRPWEANDALEVVHYETTELGKWALAVYDRSTARASVEAE